MKQRLVSLARQLGVLPALDAARFIRSKWRTSAENQAFLAAHPDFVAPPLWWMHDMYRHTSFELYWRTGKAMAARIVEHIDQHVQLPAPRIADWGCGLARLVRHLPDRYHCTGFDYNAGAIRWCAEHIRSATFLHNELRPPLAVEAASFDALYARSVFTHLSADAHSAWIAEFARVLAPGGVFIGTFHMNPAPGQLLPGEQAQFDRGELVVRGRVKEGSRTYVAYHPEAYLREDLFRGWEILGGPDKFFGQTLFIARRP